MDVMLGGDLSGLPGWRERGREGIPGEGGVVLLMGLLGCRLRRGGQWGSGG